MISRNVALFSGILIFFATTFGCGESPQRPSGEEWEPMPLYPRIDGYPAWSPDGSTIAYYHAGITEVEPNGTAQTDRDLEGIWFIDPDGSHPRLFLNGASQPAWSPDGGMLAFSGSSSRQIFTVRMDGTGLRRLTDRGCNLAPAWSPNGNMIAYVSDADAESGFDIWIMHSDGDGIHNFNIEGVDPDWSPNMRYLIYTNNEGQIWKRNLNYAVVEPVTHFAAVCAEPAYSSDNQRIAFSCFAENSWGMFPILKQIFVMDASGENPIQLTTHGGEQPCWSPDGSRIAYVCRRPQEYCSEHGTIWVMNADGSDARQITVSPVPE